jgi:hypothetical protein
LIGLSARATRQSAYQCEVNGWSEHVLPLRSLARGLISGTFTKANLLVVKLLVRAYNLVRDGSRTILSRPRSAHPPATQTGRILPRGHDQSRVLGPPLAADRGWSAHHRQHLAAHLPRLQVSDGPPCEGFGRRDVSQNLKIATNASKVPAAAFKKTS